ncbi:MAG: penicillin-binding protein [Clostridia bacterium]|nr:penicillin-binding protein [Clostridia bacterium]
MGNTKRKWYHHPAISITKKAFSAVAKIFLTVLLVGIITVSLVVSVMAVYVTVNFDGTENLPDLNQVHAEGSSHIYVQDEKTGEWVQDMKLQGANQLWTSLEDMPVYMKYAIIAIEDERYLEHNGVDWKRTISAFVNEVLTYLNLADTRFGGSTITQQLVKILNDRNSPEKRRIENKITEILQSLELEKGTTYSKDDIIEAYLNIMPMSENIVGVGYAANVYFDKDLKDCTLAECALLAGVTNNPSLYDPYERPEAARRRQRLVLTKMYECGFITEDEYKQAMGEEIVMRRRTSVNAVTDYYEDMVIEAVIEDLMEKYGYSYNYAQTIVFYGGINIYSAEIKSEQAAVEAIYADESNYPKKIEGDLEDPQTGLFIMNYDGRVAVTIGARGEKTASRIQNRSTQTTRQPGSAIKPLSVYALAVEHNLIHYSSRIQDCYITLPDGSRWPTNYKASLRDNGMVLTNYAVQTSLNTVPARLLEQLTPKRSFDFMTSSLGFSSLYRTYRAENGDVLTDMDRAPLALGALTQGVTVREMAAAYQIFGNGGVYNEPWCYYTVTQGDEVLLEKDTKTLQAVSEESAYIVNRLLQEVVTGSSGSARDIRSSWTGWEIFAKTGTTSGTDNGDRDVYFCAGTPY